MPLDLIVILALCVILTATIYNDLRFMRIPDTLTIALLALFPIYAATLPSWGAVGLHVAIGLGVFALLFISFAMRLFGGGDVKILAGLALFVPLANWPHAMLAFAAAILVSMTLILGLRKLRKWPETSWRFLVARKFPLGVPIGLAGLALCAARLSSL